MGTCCAIQQHALQHCHNPFPTTLLSQVLGLKFLRVVAHFKMAEIRDIFRRHLTEAESEVRRRYQATDASLNILEDFSRVSDWALTRRLERPSKKYQHDYVQSFPIVKRSLTESERSLFGRQDHEPHCVINGKRSPRDPFLRRFLLM